MAIYRNNWAVARIVALSALLLFAHGALAARTLSESTARGDGPMAGLIRKTRALLWGFPSYPSYPYYPPNPYGGGSSSNAQASAQANSGTGFPYGNPYGNPYGGNPYGYPYGMPGGGSQASAQASASSNSFGH